MLVDIDFIPFSEEHQASYRQRAEEFNATHPNTPIPVMLTHPPRIARGVYAAHNFNTRNVVQKVVDDVPAFMETRGGDDAIQRYMEHLRKHKRAMNKLYSQKYKRGPYKDFISYGAYGLCDSPEQLFERYPHLVDDDVPRFATFYKISRESQSPQGGFRYHKNGTYIGKQKPRHEYLYDDKHIDFICGFHLYRVEDFVSG